MEKLSPRFYGPYEVLARVGHVAYKLKFPENARIHSTVHISLLRKCSDSTVVPVHPPESVSDAGVVREPNAIMDRRMSQKKGKDVTEVLVQWKNEGLEEDSWKVWSDLQDRFPEFTKGLHP